MDQLSDAVSADDPRARADAVACPPVQEGAQEQIRWPTRRLGSRALLAFSALVVAATSIVLVHALLTTSLLAFGSDIGRHAPTQYLVCSVPLVAAILLSRHAALKRWVGRAGRLIRRRGCRQAFCLWPTYCAALVCALLQLRVPHIATPKTRAGRRSLWWLVPHAALFLGLAGASAWRTYMGVVGHDILPLGFAALVIVVQAGAIIGEMRSRA